MQPRWHQRKELDFGSQPLGDSVGVAAKIEIGQRPRGGLSGKRLVSERGLE